MAHRAGEYRFEKGEWQIAVATGEAPGLGGVLHEQVGTEAGVRWVPLATREAALEDYLVRAGFDAVRVQDGVTEFHVLVKGGELWVSLPKARQRAQALAEEEKRKATPLTPEEAQAEADYWGVSVEDYQTAVTQAAAARQAAQDYGQDEGQAQNEYESMFSRAIRQGQARAKTEKTLSLDDQIAAAVAAGNDEEAARIRGIQVGLERMGQEPRRVTSIEQVIAEALDAGDMDSAIELDEFQRRPSAQQRLQAALDIAKSPADYMTVLGMLRGELPIQAEVGGFDRVAPLSEPLRQAAEQYFGAVQPRVAGAPAVGTPGFAALDEGTTQRELAQQFQAAAARPGAPPVEAGTQAFLTPSPQAAAQAARWAGTGAGGFGAFPPLPGAIPGALSGEGLPEGEFPGFAFQSPQTQEEAAALGRLFPGGYPQTSAAIPPGFGFGEEFNQVLPGPLQPPKRPVPALQASEIGEARFQGFDVTPRPIRAISPSGMEEFNQVPAARTFRPPAAQIAAATRLPKPVPAAPQAFAGEIEPSAAELARAEAEREARIQADIQARGGTRPGAVALYNPQTGQTLFTEDEYTVQQYERQGWQVKSGERGGLTEQGGFYAPSGEFKPASRVGAGNPVRQSQAGQTGGFPSFLPSAVQSVYKGQTVQEPKQFPEIGGPKFPTQTSWQNMTPVERQMFRRAVELQGIPFEDYWEQMQRYEFPAPQRFRPVGRFIGAA